MREKNIILQFVNNIGSVALLSHLAKCKKQKCKFFFAKNCLIHWENQAINFYTFDFYTFNFYTLQSARVKRTTVLTRDVQKDLTRTAYIED